MASASIATAPYRPPLATGTPTTTESSSTINYGTSTAQPGNTYTYLYYFIVPYLDAHVLSPPSWRYAYIFWIFIPASLAIWTAIYQSNRFLAQRSRTPLAATSSSRSGRISHSTFHPFRRIRAILIRRLTSPTGNVSKHRLRTKLQLYSSNVNIGQVVTILTFTAILLAISLVGDDYISPTTCTWGGRCPVQVFNQGPPRSTYTPNSRRFRARRADIVPPPLPAQAPYQRITARDNKILLPRATALSLNPDGWAPFTDPLLSAPNTDVPRTMWTLSSRFGLIAYAMIPFVVSIGLKSWPFNIFAIPWLTYYGFDRTSVIHRWTGRLIWVWSTIHTVTFAIQLSRDINPYGHMILKDVWQYYRFNWGVAAYVALTITVCFSFNPLRSRYYEFFYCSHVVLSIVFLVGCIIHYEPLWAWATIGLALWGAERAWRLVIWLWFNGFFISPKNFWSNKPTTSSRGVPPSYPEKTAPVSPHHSTDVPMSQHSYPPPFNSLMHTSDFPPLRFEGQLPFSSQVPPTPVEIPPGFALVQVLPGDTLRITHAMVKEAKWQIGQYVLLCVPSVSWWQTHPYTISCSSSLSDFDLSNSQPPGKKLVLLLRARKGFSRKFYESVLSAKKHLLHHAGQMRNGVIVRCQISRPLGSSGRIVWDSMDNLIIVCGGSGISFGISALEEICFKIRDRSQEKSEIPTSSAIRVSRVHLVWIFREYAHLSWVALALKRCLAMVSSEELQVDLHVSNSRLSQRNPIRGYREPQLSSASNPPVDNRPCQNLLTPPHPAFLRMDSDSDTSSSPQRSSFTGSVTVAESETTHGLESQDAAIGFTDFEGENPGGSAVEFVLSSSVKDEGKRRRKYTLTRAKERHWRPKDMFAKRSKVKGEAFENPDEIDRNGNRDSGQMLLNETDNPPFDNRYDPDNPWQCEVFNSMGIDMSTDERGALEEMSERVQTGRPRLKKILRDEVEKSLGKTLVACCGPETLNSYMRKLVSQELMHPQEGQSPKYIDIYTEDFSY